MNPTHIPLNQSLDALDKIEAIGRASLRELPAKCFPNDAAKRDELAAMIDAELQRIDEKMQAARRRLVEIAKEG